MSFLYPLFLAGVAGIAAPIWLHLRRKQRTNVTKFSALRFLDDEPSPREMPFRFRDLLLLLARVLVVLLLVAGFSWPVWKSALSSAESETRIYLLDNTLSHRVNGAFERARDEVAKEVRNAGGGVQTAVVEIAARSRIVSNLATPPAEAEQAVRSIEPTHQRGSYLDAFRVATAILDRSLGAKRTIFVYGDRQKNQWDENTNVPPFLRDVQVVLAEPPGPGDAGNLFAAQTRVWRVPARDGSKVDLTLEAGSLPANKSADVVIRADDKDILNSPINLEGGQKMVQTGWDAESAKWIRGEVEMRGRPDLLPQDNRAYFAVPPIEPGRVGLLSRSPYLRAALDADIARGYWDATVLGPETLREAAASPKPRFDAVVVESDYLQAKDARDLVLQHLNNGRGAVVFVSRKTPLVEGFLRSVGVETGDERALTGEQMEIRYARLNHPVLAPFAAKDFGNLPAVRINKYIELRAAKADGLLFAADGAPVIFDSRQTKGRLLVFAFAPDTASSNWPIRPDFLPFLDLCLQYVRAVPDQQISFEPGATFFREFDNAANTAFKMERDGRTVNEATSDAMGRLRVEVPDEPGIYELRRDGQLVTLLSVSPPARESRLEYIDGRPPVIDAWTLPSESATPSAATALVKLPPPDELIWWWMLIGCAVLLAVEGISTTLRRGSA